MKRKQIWKCCGNSPIVCPLDNILHALRIHWDWVCDRHDAGILGHD